jgi:adenylate cyclase
LPLYFSRRYAEARSRYEQALKLDANFAYARVRLAEACEGAGDAARAVGEFERAASLSNTSIAKTQLARALALAGRGEEARRLLEELNAQDIALFASPYLVALAYSALGATDEAFDSLDRAAAENDKWLGWVKVDPRLDPLRSDPRFIELMGKVGFPQ